MSDGIIDSTLDQVMKIDDEPAAKKVKNPNIDPKTNHFIFKRTPAGEKVRTLVEMKGDEIIRRGVDAAYNYLNGRKAGITSGQIANTPISAGQHRSLFSALWPFILGVGVTLFFINEMIPGGLSSLFGK